MDLSDLIYERLSTDEKLCGMLASFGEYPAIFADEVPPDTSEGWNGSTQYPRICYRADMQVDQKRSSSGLLHVTIYTTKQSLDIEMIEEEIKRRLTDVLMKPSDKAPFCVSWARTEPYLIDGAEVFCKDINFDILEYPSQATTDPDSVLAASSYIKELIPPAVVCGIDRLEKFTDPSEHPVVYVELQRLEQTTGHCQNTIAWFRARLSVHILCPDSALRLMLAAGITQVLRSAEEIIMLDDSPMTIEQLSFSNTSDYLREGQISITAKYGCLRNAPAVGHSLEDIGISLSN